MRIAPLALALVLAQDGEKRPFTDRFAVDEKDLGPTGANPFFVLEPGYQLVLEDLKDEEVLTITVLDETKQVSGVETRVVEERETVQGKLVEVSRNFFAICRKTNGVYYFGEEVEIYKDGKLHGQEGAWLAGEKGARFGMIMPGTPLLGARHYQEIAPGVAMDRAEVVGLTERLEVPAGKFENVLKVEETTPLEPDEKSFKYYAPGVGLLKDGGCRLVKFGKKP
ncbi:MAG TPA: hypothetical protein VFI25_10620 [Planctomycetota bacterium]|jgi:hypothetical protein|nr:hypothetical protein [Planctomycetota bacterium]